MRRSFLAVAFLMTCGASTATAQTATENDSLWLAPPVANLVRAIPADSTAAWCASAWEYNGNRAAILDMTAFASAIAPDCGAREAPVVKRPSCWFHAMEVYRWFVERRYAMVVALCEQQFIVFHWPSAERLRIS